MSDDPRPDLDPEARGRASHDVRTPLTIISGFAEVLAGERPISEAQRRQFAARIQAAAEELRGLLDELLD